MKLAIIGSSGFVGRHLTAMCLKRSIDLVCINRKSCSVSIPQGCTSRIEFVTCNPAEDDLSAYIENCDGVICLSAIRPIKSFGLDEYLVNLRICGNVMESCIRAHQKNCVLISSRSVYSNQDQPWMENEKNIPLNLYGAAKAAADDLMEYYNAHFEMNFKSLRLAQVMGTDEVKGYLLNTLIDNASKKNRSTIYGSGCGKRQYIYINDVVSAILAAVSHPDQKGIFNIGIEEPVSIADLAALIYEVFDDPNNFEFDLSKTEDTRCYQMSTAAAFDQLEFKPEFSVRSALQDIRNNLEQ